MNFTAITTFVYSLILFIGGLVGYYKAGSIASIIMGTISAVLILICGIAMIKNSVLGYFSAAGLALLLTVFFTYRFYATEKFFPAGIMAIVSFIVIIILLFNKGMKR